MVLTTAVVKVIVQFNFTRSEAQVICTHRYKLVPMNAGKRKTFVSTRPARQRESKQLELQLERTPHSRFAKTFSHGGQVLPEFD